MEKESVNLGNAFDLGDIPKVRKVTGARKAAILLITLGADVAADIVKNLPDQYIQKIGVEISNIHKVGTRERREILQEFIEVIRDKILFFKVVWTLQNLFLMELLAIKGLIKY